MICSIQYIKLWRFWENWVKTYTAISLVGMFMREVHITGNNRRIGTILLFLFTFASIRIFCIQWEYKRQDSETFRVVYLSDAYDLNNDVIPNRTRVGTCDTSSHFPCIRLISKRYLHKNKQRQKSPKCHVLPCSSRRTKTNIWPATHSRKKRTIYLWHLMMPTPNSNSQQNNHPSFCTCTCTTSHDKCMVIFMENNR